MIKSSEISGFKLFSCVYYIKVTGNIFNWLSENESPHPPPGGGGGGEKDKTKTMQKPVIWIVQIKIREILRDLFLNFLIIKVL